MATLINNSASATYGYGREGQGSVISNVATTSLIEDFAISGTKTALKTDEMFVLSKGEINKYYFIYHFYNWFAFKHGIAGMDSESQKLLKKYLLENSDTKELQLADIYKLKDAIKQDKASIEFVVKLCRNYDGAKQALDKMKNDGSAKL